MHIYKTTNIINGLIYIGQTKKDRITGKKYLGSGVKLKKAIKEFGKDNFTNEILQECNNKEELNQSEIFWISHFNSTDPNIGYNIHKGGAIDLLELSDLLSKSIKKTLAKPEQKIKSKIRNKKLWEDFKYRNKVTDSNVQTWSDQTKLIEHSKLLKEKWKNPIAKNNLITALNSMEKIECPHCGKICTKNLAHANHLDNCTKHSNPEKRIENIIRRNQINQNTKKIQCPHCLKIGTVGNMNRWHFDNCKKINLLQF